MIITSSELSFKTYVVYKTYAIYKTNKYLYQIIHRTLHLLLEKLKYRLQY